jgi:hypothetical protein
MATDERRQLFIRLHNETLSVVAMRVNNPDRSTKGLTRRCSEFRKLSRAGKPDLESLNVRRQALDRGFSGRRRLPTSTSKRCTGSSARHSPTPGNAGQRPEGRAPSCKGTEGSEARQAAEAFGRVTKASQRLPPSSGHLEMTLFFIEEFVPRFHTRPSLLLPFEPHYTVR